MVGRTTEIDTLNGSFESKESEFVAVTKTRKAVHLTLVTAHGLVHNAHWNLVQSEVILDDLFRE